MHYNEFQAVQLAKKLMAQEDDDDEDDAADNAEKPNTTPGASNLNPGVAGDVEHVIDLCIVAQENPIKPPV
ncbi:hypothetical protein ElyMa_002220300 [Elysia marginata]|uniref:Uncharacterized protein n=1 Tax=Elysia marginata TaxID=1093978 RepID=A0AAV4FUP7_9GAST|nr:hypothetical protein ElyMa_002220300 [Elysia marginata]